MNRASDSFCYVHIPFCESKCRYCRFASVGDIQSLRIAKYVASLKDEIESSCFCIDTPLKSVYFGGGTPSTLDVSQVQMILDTLENQYGFDKKCEISFESTPNKIDISYVQGLQKIGVNRISIGVQSLNTDTLKEIGRGDKGDIFHALDVLQEIEFENVSLDFIIGLPYVALGEVKNDIALLLNRYSCIKHISVYMLEDYYEFDRDEKSAFHKATYPENWKTFGIKEENYAAEYDEVASFLEKKGFLKYEISNFAKPGYECKHNQAYWNHQNILAFGLGASGLVNHQRYTNSEEFGEYYGRKGGFKEELSEQDIFLEKVMFGLRTKGLSKDIFEHLNQKRIDDFVREGFLVFRENKSMISLTHKGVLFLDYIIKEIL